MISCCSLVAERHDDRRHHAGQTESVARAFVGSDFVEDVLLREFQAGAAELLWPADADPALRFVQRAMPAEDSLRVRGSEPSSTLRATGSRLARVNSRTSFKACCSG